MAVNELEILEELIDDDPFIRTYPSFHIYLNEWDDIMWDLGSDEEVPEEIIFEFYAEKTPVPEGVSIWLMYKES